MDTNNKSAVLLWLGAVIAGLMFFAGCSKEGATKSSANAQINLVNISPDVLPFNLYGNFIKYNQVNYRYPTPSGYFLLNVADTPFEIRPATASTVIANKLLPSQSAFQRNVRYTWFVTGLRADSSLVSLVVTDTGSVPAVGRGKIRFINASPNAGPLNITANDTLAFSGINYKQVSGYREVTAGNYNFKVSAAASPKTTLTDLSGVSILDGQLYTIYTYGLTGRSDSAAFKANIILNSVALKYN